MRFILSFILILFCSFAYADVTVYRGSTGASTADGRTAVSSTPFTYDVSHGEIAGHTNFRGLGYNSAIGTTLEDITETGQVVIPLLENHTSMEIISSEVEDVGTVMESGTVTTASVTHLIDSAATFQTYSVSVGDMILNDTDLEWAYVDSVDSETVITVRNSSNSGYLLSDSYRIVTNANTGCSIIEIHGLDNDFMENGEFVVTNGDTAVDTVNKNIGH